MPDLDEFLRARNRFIAAIDSLITVKFELPSLAPRYTGVYAPGPAVTAGGALPFTPRSGVDAPLSRVGAGQDAFSRRARSIGFALRSPRIEGVHYFVPRFVTGG